MPNVKLLETKHRYPPRVVVSLCSLLSALSLVWSCPSALRPPPSALRSCSPTGPLLLAVCSPFAQVVFQQLGSQNAAAFGDHYFARQQPGDDFGYFPLAVTSADADGPHVENFGRAFGEVVLVPDENDLAICLPFSLHRLAGNDGGLRFLAKDNPAGAEGVGSQPARGVGQERTHFHGARLLVCGGADPAHLAGRFLTAAIGAETHGLTDLQGVGILEADMESQPHEPRVRDYKE